MLFVGCKPALLPRSNLEDTPENRPIVDFINRYIKAVEHRSVEEVMALVASDYLETNGNTDPSDDYGYTQLRSKLELTFSKTKDLRLLVYIQKVLPQVDGTYHIIYYFKQNALMEFPSDSKWMAASDVNRLIVRKKADGDYEIIAGL